MPLELSPSNVELASSCLYPFRPDVPVEKFLGNVYTERGNLFHAAVMAIIVGLPVPSLPHPVSQWFDAWCSHYESTDFEVALCEVALALDIGSLGVRVLGFDIERKYKEHGAKPNERCGSVDLAVTRGGVLYVYDWKTGAQRKLTRRGNPQVRVYTAMLMKVLGYNHGIGVTVVINEEGVQEYLEEVFDADEVLKMVSDLAFQAETLEPDPTPGDHCSDKYCPIRTTCPALTQAKSIVRTPTIPLATKEDVASTIEKLLHLEAQAKAIWEKVDERVKELGDITLPNGKVYGEKETQPKEVIQYTKQTAQVLAEHGIEVVPTVTKKAIEDGVKKVSKRGEAAALKRAIFENVDIIVGTSSKTMGWK